MNFVFASPLESVNDVDSLALQETARPQTVPQTRFGGRIYSETGHFSRKFSSRTRSKFITGSSLDSMIVQNTRAMGERAVRLIHAKGEGQPFPALIQFEPLLVTRENVNSAVVQQMLYARWMPGSAHLRRSVTP